MSRASARVQTLAVPRVMVVLMSGKELTGKIVGTFSPYLSHIMLVQEVAGGEAASPTAIPVETAAYMAFFREQGEPVSPPLGGAGLLSLKLVGGRSLHVHCPQTATDSGLGFHAVPSDPQSPFKRLFIFAHGVTVEGEAPKPLPEPPVFVEMGDGIAMELSRAMDSSMLQGNAFDVDGVPDKRSGRVRLGEALMELGLATQEQIEMALAIQREKKGGKQRRLGEVLVEMGVITEREVCTVLATKFNLPLVDLDEYPIDPVACEGISTKLIKSCNVLPIAVTDRALTVAISDPLSTGHYDALRFQVTKRLVEVLVTPSQLKIYITRHLREAGAPAVDGLLDQLSLERDQASEEGLREPVELRESDSAVIKLANQIILEGFRRNASDIHIEPDSRNKTARVRFRVDGECSLFRELPLSFARPLVARLKIVAGVDVAERRKPQDGKIRLRIDSSELELRLATLPTLDGHEDVVMRLGAATGPLPLEKLDLSEQNLLALRGLMAKPYGLLLCVGPTGSGKTTTLHSMLAELNSIDRKICTAEDPVEIVHPGLRQVQVNPKIGLTFATSIRAFLRNDPDVIMIGEMRDADTSSAAIEASLTGHLVLSTLHTNTAPETVVRLVDMGLDIFSFSDSLLGVLAQRLARRLCKECSETYSSTPEEFNQLVSALGEDALARSYGLRKGGSIKLWRGRGCEACGQSGYRGRVGLHELLVVNDEIKHAIQAREPALSLRIRAEASGMITLMHDGFTKAVVGLTDLKQVFAVCQR